jgi:SAM-dependent methyltransferase
MALENASAVYGAGFRESYRRAPTGSAAVIVPMVLVAMPIRSVVDVGCGTASWAAEFRAHGVDDVLGVDGSWANRAELHIPRDRFLERDLEAPIRLDRRFDLAVCLEVAEHLPESRAAGLIDDLVGLSPCVLFSAAIPGQGGTHHVNEQYLSYWAQHFERHGFVPVDLIRPRIWNNEDVQYWYRQNIILFAAPDHAIAGKGPNVANDYIHPEYVKKMQAPMRPPILGELFRAFGPAVRRSIQSRWRKMMH